jgi:hypothetical protein
LNAAKDSRIDEEKVKRGNTALTLTFNSKYPWDDESDLTLIRAVQRYGPKWATIRRKLFSHWFDDEASTRGRAALANRWNSLSAAKDSRIDEEKVKRGNTDIRGFF